MRWSHSIITPASIEVIGLEEAKAELDVTFNDDDSMIMRQLAAAIQFVEGYSSTFLAPTLVELRLSCFPPAFRSSLMLPFGPVQGVTSVQSVYQGTTTAFLGFDVLQGEAWALRPGYGYVWPQGEALVRFTAGYPDGQCPEGLIQAVMLALRAYYEAPDPASIGAQLEAARQVAAPFKRSWL